MAKVRSANNSKKTRPAITPEGRESQMIAYAVDLAEQQLRDGTASSQVITHFLKLATEKAQLEKEKIKQENKLLEAKVDALNSERESNVDYQKVLAAIRNYSGQGDEDDYEFEDY